MVSECDVPFLTGKAPYQAGLLARYLSPLNEGVATAWLKSRLPPGSWVLDPFGSDPRIAAEAARAGYKILVAANNPVSRALLELELAPPSPTELRSALAELAAAYRGKERIEPHIRSLYDTECKQCGATIMAEAFLWEKQAEGPYARIYTCPHCSDAGERPATPKDRERATAFASDRLHKARALERVAPPNDPDRNHAEEAISAYLPRAVYALFTLINKLNGMSLSDLRRKHLEGLLLHTCDQANTLWSHPTVRERPRQLAKPPRFRENNVWLALEEGINLWSDTHRSGSPPLPKTLWPEYPPPEGGVILFEGRYKELATTVKSMDISAAITVLPRPNQAFWTLSALWAGWLWGHEATSAFKPVLRRRRFDWAWHTNALTSAMKLMAENLNPDTPFLALTGENEPGFQAAAILAGELAGFEIEGFALRPETAQFQIYWQINPLEPGEIQDTKRNPETPAKKSAIDYLQTRGQPSVYLPLQAAVLTALAKEHAFPHENTVDEKDENQDPSPSLQYQQLQAFLRETFTYRNGFLRFEGVEGSLGAGYWWLHSIEKAEGKEQAAFTLSDRIEMAVVRFLNKYPASSTETIDQAICTELPGLLTPDPDLVQLCLESYAERDANDPQIWQIRTQEAPSIRRSELNAARELVLKLGKRLGFQVMSAEGAANINSPNTQTPFLWIDERGETQYAFYILASAVVGGVLLSGTTANQRSIIIIPGGRAKLVLFKLQKDPRLRLEVEKGQRFLKYRHLRWLHDNPNLNQKNFEDQIDLDPLTEAPTQMRLL
jgi:hypothetical protein